MGIINKLSWRDIKGSHRLMVLFVIMLGLLNFFFGERVPAAGGLGWDGVTYADMVRNLDKMISDGLLDNYYAQRILPSAIVRSMLLLSGAQISDPNIIRGFELYNLFLLLVACWTWRRLADHFSISLGGRWIGFCGLFLSFQSSKQAFYCPVLTDVTALLIGMVMLLFFIKRWPVALLAATIFGAFTWQVASICGSTLLLFLKTDTPMEAITPSPMLNSAKFHHAAKLGWVILLIMSVLGFGALIAFKVFFGPEYSHSLHLNAMQRAITTFPSLAAVGFALVLLVGSMRYIRTVIAHLRTISLLLVLLSFVAILLPWSIQHLIANPALANPYGYLRGFSQCLQPPSGKFLLPFITLAVFWGPMVLLLLLNWHLFCLEARKLGTGFVLVIAMSLPLILATEPRYITLAWPFFVLGGVLVMERTNRGKWFKYLYAVLTILSAQFWMKLNIAPWSSDYYNLHGFPKQMYAMHYGAVMDWWPYLIQLGVIGVCIVWMKRTLRPDKWNNLGDEQRKLNKSKGDF